MAKKHKTGIDEAIAAAGSQENLAALMGVHQQTVSYWKLRGFAPARRVKEIEMHTGVARSRLLDPALKAMANHKVTM